MSLTVLSRLGYLNLAGVAVVASNSMEPSIRRFDLVLYANTNYTVGDVVVYCLTPSYCYVHRVVGFIELDTVNGAEVMVVTKGDNAYEADSPVKPALVKGRVILVVPWELWIPMLIVLIACSLIEMSKLPVIGLSHALVFIVGLASVIAVYALVPQSVNLAQPDIYVVSLAGLYMDHDSCTVSIRYNSELSLSDARSWVNGKPADVVSLGDREITLKPDPLLLSESFERGTPLHIAVQAFFNHAVRLMGEYSMLVGGRNPEIAPFNGALLVRNANCFPIRVKVSVLYFDDDWRWLNTTYTVSGFSYLVVEPPETSRYAYAYIYWFNQGEERWLGLILKPWRGG